MGELCRLRIFILPLVLITQLLLLLSSITTAKTWNGRTYNRYQSIDDYRPHSLQISIYPTEENIYEGRDASFNCRASTTNGITYPEVRWTRYDAPMPASAYETDGRLKFTSATPSDSGRYVCSASYGGRNYDAYAQLNVHPYGPQEFQSILPQTGICRFDERACGNNECVKSEYVCDGEPDCRDRSDEQNCPSLRSCEPNEFKCNNGRCVQKMWLCDGDDDCGDNSDELACSHRAPSDGCSANEFKCRDGRQCVPLSFHCDGTNDCQDGSDEIGCVQPTIVQPPETNKQVYAGGTFQLTCKAVAVPEPYINWRLNWGPVCDPPRCTQYSEGGLGTLTVKNAQALDQGAYTCEAINVKGRVLATPDCIVRIVNIPAPESQSKTQCNIIGSVSPVPDHTGRCQCKALVMGLQCDSCIRGAYHLHEKAEQGCLKCFCFGVTDQCQSSKWYRTKDKLILNGESRGVQISDINGQVHSSRFDYSKPGMVTYSEPSYQTMYWKLPSRFLGNKLTAYGGELAFDIQYSCTGSVNNEPLVVIKGNGITLVHRPRDPYIFTSDKTIRYTVGTYETNYEELDGRPATRENLMMVLANVEMVLIRATHCYGQQNTRLGDITWEIAVDRDTQERFALEVEHCSCPPGYIGLSCEDCAPGYERSPQGPYLGTCVPAQHRVQCSSAGARSAHPGYDGRCQCVTQQCASASNYYRTQVIIDYSRGATDQLEITTSDAHNPFTPQSQAQITGRDITFTSFYEIPGQTLYWKMPEQFLGNKVTSYGGKLKYVFRYSCTGPPNIDPDVILRGNDITLQYTNHQTTYPDRENIVEINLFEDHWQRMDGQLATREHLLMALADLDTLLIKTSYLDDCSSSSLISVSLDYAEPHVTGGEIAYEVEQCQCPPGYIGTSCEDCAPGYSRTGGGLYLGLCERCECHGHASQCDKEHGFCVDCQHNTEGDQCERCKPGFTGDARRGTPHDCQPAATRPACMCNNHSPRGCDSFGRCLLCEHNTEGYHCEQCKRGFYGDAIRGTPFDCTPCPCPGASDCFLDAYGQVQCRNCPAGLTGRLCEECAPGYTRSRSRARVDEGRICEPIGHVEETNIVFVPTPEAYGPPLRVQIDPPKNLNVPVGSRARWYCRVVGQRSPGIRLQWSKVGTAGLPSNAAQYDGELVIDGVQEFDSGQYRCTGSGDHQFATDDATLNVEPKARPVYGRPPPVMVDPLEQTVNVNDMATFRCWVPGLLSCELKWYKDDIGGQLPHGVYQADGTLKIPHARLEHAGNYICTASNEYGIGKSPPARLIVKQPQQRPRIDPQENTVAESEPARFRCWVPGDPTAILTWKMKGNGPLPPDVQQHEGILNIPSSQRQHAGSYICTASDPMGYKPPVDSPVARLIVRPASNPLVDPPEQRVSENQPAQFRCWVPGNPTAVLQWRRADGRPLGYGVSDRQGILSIARAQLSDAGEYICSARDLYGGAPVDSSPARLHVDRLYQPSIQHSSVQPLESFQKPQVDPKHQMVYEGDPAMFRCWVPFNPNVRLKWSRADGTPLPISAYDDGTGTLYYLRAHVSDADFYVCSVIDPDSGLPIESDPVELKVKPYERRKEIVPSRGAPTVDPIEQTVTEGDPSQIRCFVPGDPNAVLRWRKQDGELPIEATQNQGILYIPQTESDDAGSYICTLEDHFGGAPPIDSVPARVHVKQQENIPLVIPASLTVNKGDLVRFLCYIPDEQTQSLRWGFKDRDGPLPTGAYVYYGVLTIRAHLNDTGKYICTDDRTSQSAMPVILTVKSNDDNDAIQKLQNIHDTDEYNNHLEEEQQQQQYENHDNGLEIMDENTTHEYDEHGNNHDNISNHDYGDNHEYETKHHHINEYGGKPPRPVATPSDQVVKVGETARFHCDPNSDTPATVRWGYETADGPLRGDVVAEGNDLMIRSADNSDAGEYICTATNPYGSGEAEPVRLHVTEKEEPPTARVVPRVWNGQHGDKHQFQCVTTGSPEPTIVWTGPSGEGLPEDVTDIGGGFLDFQNARADMNGDYTCTATNIVGEASDHGSVNIGPSLTVRTSPPGPRIVLTAGEPLEVKCEAFGEPEPEVEWLHDPGPERGDLPDDFKPVTISEQFIRHPNIGVGNAGVYTCRGSNIQASAKKDIYIEVVEPSKVATVSILGGSTQWFEPGKPVDLICAATGSEIIDRIQWVKIDGTLPDDAKETELGILHLPKFRKFDSGEYECRGYRHNELVGSNRVTIHATTLAPLDVARVEIDPPMIRVIDQGESIKLTCTVEGGDNDGANFEWALLRGGNIIRQYSDDNTLIIKKADPSNDYGVYRCEVEDDDGELIGQAYTAVTIGFTDPSNARIVKFDEKSTATIECPVYAIPGAVVTWEKEDGDLPAGTTTSSNKLIIDEFDDDAVGMYICKVDIEGKQIEGYVKAEIYVPDTIIQVLLEPSSESISLGDRAWFDCKVTGDPDAEITWTKEGEDELPDNTQVMGNRLLFVNVREDNGGIYKCHAKTKAGPLETRNVLNVGIAKHKIPSKSIQRVKESVPVIIGAVGEETEIRCPATGAPGVYGEVKWEKVNGELPYAYSIHQDILHLKDTKRTDEGVYRCITRTDSGLATVTHVHLKVSDFVPSYNGDGYMELKPLTDEQWSDINMKISFKPKSSNGLLLYTERQNENNPDEIINYLSIGLKNGHVIYRYNVGAGPAEIKSVYPVVMDEWHKVEIFNQPNQAGLLVDEDDIVEQDNYYFNTGEGISKIINVAGTRDKATLERTTFEQPFVGTITSIIISDENVNFGENTVTKSSNIQKDTACSLGLCQHNSICIPTNVHIGFVCDCSTARGYEGEFCERKILKCSHVTCEAGTCEYRSDGTQFCHCPVGRYGDRCQLLDGEDGIESIQFNGETSYIVLPKSKTLRNFSLKIEIQPHSINDQLLAYEASDYNPKRSNYLALAIRRRKFVYLYNSANGNTEIESPDEVQVNVPYRLDLKRFGNRAEFRINGTRIPSRGKLSAFLSGTNLFIGGIPPGITVNPRIGGAASFKGCISKIVVNGKDVNLVEILKKSSHDVTICKPYESKEDMDIHVPFIWTTTTSIPTTRTTIRITTSDNSLFKTLEKDNEEWTDDEIETTDMISYPEENLATCTGEDCAVQCMPDTCGDHGDCEIINATHITCSCRDYYDGPTCEIFKPIDHAAKFDGNAFIVFSIDDFPHLTSEHEESLCLRFKTNASNGLIFWQGQQLGTPLRGDDYMSVGLNNGYLVFSYELGGGASQLVSAEKVNDDKEHELKIWRKGRYGKMTIDDGPLVTGSSFGLVAMLNVDGDIYIERNGINKLFKFVNFKRKDKEIDLISFSCGLPELDDMTGGLYTKNFVGCIADIIFNGVEMDLMANAIDGRNVKPCDQWMTKKRPLRSGKYY
ncbi:Basement membrane proteoglycan [Dirofilaria immitis]